MMMVKSREDIIKDLKDKLSRKEKRIFNSVLNTFPKTDPRNAYDIAIQGGIKFDFICK